MMPRKTARNQEIMRRLDAGERPTDLADEFGLHITRISQIARQERARASEPPKPPSTDGLSGALEREEAMRAKVRPRLRKVESGQWECTDGIVSCVAHTQLGAYQRWLTAALLEEERRLFPAASPDPGPDEPEPEPEPEPAAEKPVPEIVTPATPPAIRATAKPAPYVGPVTVVKGAPAVEPLNLASICPTMAGNMARAKAAQPPLTTMGGWSKKRNDE